MHEARSRAAAAAFAVAAALALAVPGLASAATPELQLAERYAPVVALKQQDAACDTEGEPYRPVPADVVLGHDDVRLVDADGALIKAAPTAAGLVRQGSDTYLDFPGSPLDPGCRYEEWANSISAGAPTTAYAHVVREGRQLALQYWFYYVFNDWNNKHEGDWEMIQLLFDAPTAAAALKRQPAEIGYSQHSGAERSGWDDAKLSKRGLHPVVHPGSGSHANYFGEAVWLGASAQEGFGCDDTTGPSRMLQTQAVLLPARPPLRRTADFAWLGFDGHWGQQASGPNTGPTGPAVKSQWTKPVTWAEDEWRDSSSEIPLTETVGPSATSFFCSAVAAGSRVYLRFLRTPWFVLGVLAAICLFAVWLGRRTRWSPALPLPVDEERTGGQIYRAAARLYRRYIPLFLGLGIVFVPLSVLAALAQAAVLDLTGVGDFLDVASVDPVVAGIVALLFGQLSTAVAAVLVSAAVAAAVHGLDAGEHPDVRASYRAVLSHLGPLALAWVRIIAVAGLLTLTIVGIPFAVVYLVRKAVVTQACVVEGLPAGAALDRSSDLVRGHGPRVLAIAALVNVTAYLLGPIAGVVALFLTSSSLAVINVISSLVYAVVVPYASAAIALLFYDLRRRHAGEPVLSAPAGAVPSPS